MGFTIQVGETRPVLDQNGAQIVSATQPGLPWGPGLAATMHDSGGILVCTGYYGGTVPFTVYGPGGVTVTHEVTIEQVGPPFDWSLGDPV